MTTAKRERRRKRTEIATQHTCVVIPPQAVVAAVVRTMTRFHESAVTVDLFLGSQGVSMMSSGTA